MCVEFTKTSKQTFDVNFILFEVFSTVFFHHAIHLFILIEHFFWLVIITREKKYFYLPVIDADHFNGLLSMVLMWIM